MDVNVEKALTKEIGELNNIGNLTRAQALNFLKILSSYQATGVPEDLKGFDPSWTERLT